MISSESRTISGLRRMSTPSAPVQKRKAATQRYQTTSGPFTSRPLALARVAGSWNAYACSPLRLRGRGVARVAAEDHAAHRCDQQRDRGDLEREQVVGQESE